MRDGWCRVVLGEVAHVDIEREQVNPQRAYRVVGVLNAGQGLFDRGLLGGEATNYPALHRLRAGQVVMRKLTAWEGPVAVVPPAFDGFYVSTEFPTFSLDTDQILPEFMQLECQRPSFWHALKDRSTGTVQRRKRVNPTAFLTVPILLPPLPDQRRIVDLVTAIDQCAVAVEQQQAAISNAACSFRETGLAELASEVSTVGDVLLRIEAGRSPAAIDRLPLPGERAVLKVSAIRFGEFDPGEAKTVDARISLPDASRVRAGDVLMTRANTRRLVGAVCRVVDSPDGYFLCDKTLRLVPDERRIVADFLVEVLQSAQAREQIELAATGTSASMKNISQGSIRSLRIPLPPIDEQIKLATIMDELRAVGGSRGRRPSTVRCSCGDPRLASIWCAPDSRLIRPTAGSGGMSPEGGGFSESSTIQAAIVQRLARSELGWKHVPGRLLDRTTDMVLVESEVVEALRRLNPAIDKAPERVDEVLPLLRAACCRPCRMGSWWPTSGW